MPWAHLTDRAVLKVSGEEARGFLDRLVTCDLDKVSAGRARLGALLTPQGKLICDFILSEAQEAGAPAFYLDAPLVAGADLAKRLTMYRLRAKVAVVDVSTERAVMAGWGDTAMPTGEKHLAAPDPRVPALGWRAIVERGGLLDGSPADEGEGAYHAHRIALGVPEGGRDFAFNDAFPHEALMDQMSGVDFDKGCYVGQEVVSRMQHRGTARTRIVSLDYGERDAPPPGTEATAGDRVLGHTASSAGSHGLAMLRLDRATEALAAGQTISAGGRTPRFARPDWVHFAYPGETSPAP